MAAGKRYVEARKKVDSERLYSPEEALSLVKEVASAKFDETVECHIRTGVDPRHADQMVRGSVVLPAGTGKRVRVLAFAQGEQAREAEEAGADYVGAEDLVQRIQGGWMEFDVAVATPDVMPMVQRLGRVLGPRGLLPNPRTGTVSMEIGRLIRDVRAGRVEFRVDRTAVVHAPIGKASFSSEQLRENLTAFMDAILRAKPAAAKGQYIRSITLAPTMGPGVKLEIQPTVALVGSAS
ncbi:MAG TPA: 50S ribosomal protein L1 [Chloroflexota bacterium]|nr:50S ribosomal protein L1 [Chloroflexota bacterium]